MKRCVVLGAVEIDFPIEKYIRESDFVICADRGWKHAKAHGIKPDMIVGDFDSSPQPEDTDASVTVLPVVKDDTDTFHIARYIVEKGYTDVLLAGVIGGKRPEHTFANIQTLNYLAHNRINATALTATSQFMVINDGKIVLPDMPGRFFSLFSMGDKAEGVSIKGAKYTLDDAEITSNYQYAVSNEVLPGQTAEISVKEGRLLLIKDL